MVKVPSLLHNVSKGRWWRWDTRRPHWWEYRSSPLTSAGEVQLLPAWSKGELKIVDPYCGERTLDILRDVKNKTVKFLTRVENLGGSQRNRLIRELQDFKSENPKVEFRNYPHTDIHDRYIISSELLVILGHSIKDLGAKESFAIILNKDRSKNAVEALIENFDRRWKQSSSL